MKSLLLVTMLSVGTALTTMGRLKPVAASLTPPATYNYSYTWNAAASEQYLNVNGVDSIPLYTRTADGVYYNYTSTFNVINGFNLTQLFSRSNSTWQVSGTSYKPDEARIGSDATVGTPLTKYNILFNNQTPNAYYVYLDNTSTGGGYFSASINDLSIMLGDGVLLYTSNTQFNRFYLPSYSTLRYTSRPSSSLAAYFDAWYLQDLGISASYQQGLDAQTDGILTDYLGTDAQQIGWVLIGIAAILFAFKGGK